MYLAESSGLTPIVVAVISSSGAIVLGVINYVFNRRLNDWKELHENQLTNLKAEQQAALADFQTRANERLEALKASLARAERIESDIVRSRGEAYGEIWGLTGALSLFGPARSISASELSGKLSHWYFEQGWLLTQESKSRYFLIQEVLNFFILHSLPFRRPAEEILFASPRRPNDELRTMRAGELGIDPRGDEGRYTLQEMQQCVSAWKTAHEAGRETTSPEQAWVLLQFAMSSFRSHLVEELKSRDVFAGPALPPPSVPTVPKSA